MRWRTYQIKIEISGTVHELVVMAKKKEDIPDNLPAEFTRTEFIIKEITEI